MSITSLAIPFEVQVYSTKATSRRLAKNNSLSKSSTTMDLADPTQTVITKGSQGGKDIVQHIAYDEYGREAYKYLPYVHNQSDGTYKPDAPTQQHGFYNGASPLGSHVAQDADPYSRTIFEPSPLNRVLKQGAPGTAWQPKESYTADDKAVVFEYTTNGHNEVYLWEIKDDQCVLGDGQYYEPNQLYVSITKDENWTSGNNGTVREYKDKQGRVVLKRTYDTNKPHDTYYVYDDFGNLRVVLPPEAIHSLGSSLDGLDEDNVFTSNGSVPRAAPASTTTARASPLPWGRAPTAMATK
jgi:hypothetical protein